MCGICGEINFGINGPVHEKVMLRMLDALRHRGPDDFGIFYDGIACLGHRRLSIIDLSDKARQPLSNEDGSIWIVFNGEIYNFLELRTWLERKGHIFKSKTDTEVILHLYEEMGEELFSKLNGMFSFGLWDSKNQKLLLARDRIGVKPLVYYYSSSQIVFASEIKALLRHPSISKEIDWEGMELFFTFNFIPAPWTIFKDIKKLEPGHYIVFDKRGLRIHKCWDLPTPQYITNEEEAISRLRDLVNEATKIRLISDVPLGALLSGGLDSSVVVAYMAANSSRPVNTFFIRYGEDKLFDESLYARAVAEMYGTNHHEIDLSPSEGLNYLPEIVSSFDEPFADSSAIPTYLVCKLARQGITVALSGDGGDEIFGGYRRYLGEKYINYYLKIPPFIRKKFIKPFVTKLPDSKGRKWLEYNRRLKIFINGADESQKKRHYYWLVYFPDKDRNELFRDEIKMHFNSLGYNLIKNLYQSYPSDDTVNKMLYVDFKNLLPYDMLTKVDWMSMQNSLEIRSPLLDYRIAEFAFSLPGSFKVKKTTLKYIFKKAFNKYLPQILWNRPKQGFEIPIGEWLKRNNKFQKLFWNIVDFPGFSSQKIFNLKKIKSLFDEHQKNRRDNSHKLWAIFVFQWWYQHEYGLK